MEAGLSHPLRHPKNAPAEPEDGRGPPGARTMGRVLDRPPTQGLEPRVELLNLLLGIVSRPICSSRGGMQSVHGSQAPAPCRAARHRDSSGGEQTSMSVRSVINSVIEPTGYVIAKKPRRPRTYMHRTPRASIVADAKCRLDQARKITDDACF